MKEKYKRIRKEEKEKRIAKIYKRKERRIRNVKGKYRVRREKK